MNSYSTESSIYRSNTLNSFRGPISSASWRIQRKAASSSRLSYCLGIQFSHMKVLSRLNCPGFFIWDWSGHLAVIYSGATLTSPESVRWRSSVANSTKYSCWCRSWSLSRTSTFSRRSHLNSWPRSKTRSQTPLSWQISSYQSLPKARILSSQISWISVWRKKPRKSS